MAPAKKPKPAVVAKPAPRRAASSPKTPPSPVPATMVKAGRAVKAVDIDSPGRAASRHGEPMLKTIGPSAETTVTRAKAVNAGGGRPRKAQRS
jgi:hypothetical protein